MCLGETRNNQGDRFVYDGKISKSKRKLLVGGINVFTSSFLRAKHIPSIIIGYIKAFRCVSVSQMAKMFMLQHPAKHFPLNLDK